MWNLFHKNKKMNNILKLFSRTSSHSNSKMIKDKKLVTNTSGTSYSYILLIIAGVSMIFIGLYYQFLYLPPLPPPIDSDSHSTSTTTIHQETSSSTSASVIPNSSIQNNDKTVESLIQIPKIIHQMWKDNYDTIPYDLKRWRAGCQQVNHNYEFRFYYDSDLKTFVTTYYPEYLALFNSLHGVFMADMARILYVYHYGGIYMDLDFYCVRNFDCMIKNIEKQYNLNILREEHIHYKKAGHVLIVPNEPYLQSIMLYLNNRTIIQDYFAATPKHPFFKWLLDERNSYFHASQPHTLQYQFDSSTAAHKNDTTTETSHFSFSQFYPNKVDLPIHLQYTFNPKKPFSHHFDQDLDRYYYSMSTAIEKIKSNTKTTTSDLKLPAKVIKLLQPNIRLELLQSPTHRQLSVSASASTTSTSTSTASSSSRKTKEIHHPQKPALNEYNNFNNNNMNNNIQSHHKLKNTKHFNTNHHHKKNNKHNPRQIHRKLTSTTATERGQESHVSTIPLHHIPRSGYVVELSEKELHPLVDGANWRLESFCQAVNYIYTNKQLFNIENADYITYVNDINTRDNSNKGVKLLKTDDYKNILLKDTNKNEAIIFIHKQHILHYNKYTESIKIGDHKADLKKLCSWYETKHFYHPDSTQTIAVHMWSHVYFNILGWNYFRNYFNKPVYTHVETASPATLLCV